LFSENQVLLDVMRGGDGFLASSVFLVSLDDISAQDNQFAIWAGTDLFLTNLLILAGSMRIAGNRLSETLLRCFLSSIGIGVMTTMSLNQSTHCLFASSLLGAPGLINSGNIVLIDALSRAAKLPSPCTGDFAVFGK
jgi:hypothetical protein